MNPGLRGCDNHRAIPTLPVRVLCFMLILTTPLQHSPSHCKYPHSEGFVFPSSRGVNECNVVVSGNLAELVESCFSNETCIHKETDLSSISVKLPTENVSVPGIYYFVFHCFN